MKPYLLILDIGSTLVDGPPVGPAGRFANLLDLDEYQTARLAQALMIEQFRNPYEVSSFIRHELNAEGPVLRAAIQIWEHQEEEAAPVVGALEVLEELAAEGFYFSLLSNIWQPYLTSVRKHFGGFFDRHVPPEWQIFSFRRGLCKPSAELLRSLFEMARSSCNLEEAIVIGDSYAEDIFPATQAGALSVWLTRRLASECAVIQDLLDGSLPSPTLAIDSISDLSPKICCELIVRHQIALTSPLDASRHSRSVN